MATELQYIEEIKPDHDGALTRGYYVTDSTLSLSFEETPVASKFGKSPKDVIEMTVYNLEKEFIGWRIVGDKPVYETLNLEFTNYEGEYTTGTAQIFTENYTSVGTSVLVSPTNDLNELELDRGAYYVRYSFLNDLCGSHENSSKLVIKDISQTRTEIKVVPECLKVSRAPADVSLSYEYINLINKRLPGATLYNFTDELLKDTDVRSHEYQQELVSLVTDYDDVVDKAITMIGGGAAKDVFINAETLKSKLYKLYRSVLLTKYNNTYTKSDYYIEYLNSVNYIISSHPRLGNESTDSLVVDFFKTILISLFDVDYLESMYSRRFDTYLNNFINFGNGKKYPILGIIPTNENIDDEQKHQPIVLKLYEPLPTNTQVGTKIYISSGIYSDDVMQKCNFFKTTKLSSFKLRGPDLSISRSLTGTKELKQEDLQDPTETKLDEVTKNISSYFNKSLNNNDKDYSNFKNFVKYSSATRQLETFYNRFVKISRHTRNIRKLEYTIQSLEVDIENNIVGKGDSSVAISVLRQVDLEDSKKLLAEELATLSDYERFLFYTEDSDFSWPRNDYLSIYGITGKNKLCNGRYIRFGVRDTKPKFKHEFGDWYIWWEAVESVWVMSDTDSFKLSNWLKVKNESYYFAHKISDLDFAGFDPTDRIYSVQELMPMSMFESEESFVLSPEYIPENTNEWKSTESYAWYNKKLQDAIYYDKQNDESLVMNIPEFLIRDESNSDFVDFLNIIGLHFDELHGYIENMGNSRAVRNSRDKGIPDQLIYYFLNSLGMNFAGQDSASDDTNKSGQTDKMSVEYRRNQIWRRILNNLPYILKTKGTLASVNALLRCYDIPEQLFSVREYGGTTEYSDDASNRTAFVFDSYDYGLSIMEENQYIEFPWSYEKTTPNSIEFKLILNEASKKLGTDIAIIEGDGWTFGVRLLPGNNRDYGRFYLKTPDYESVCPTGDGNPVYMWYEGGYDILLQKSQSFNALKRKTISILVKRKIDNTIVYSDTTDVIVNEHTFNMFSSSKSIYIGNYKDHKFRGILDRVRIYATPIEESSFENHVLFSNAYDIQNTEHLKKSLLFKTNIDSPHDLSETTNYKTGYGILVNSAFGPGLADHARCFNFTKTEYPFEYVGKFKREFAQLPSFGSHAFNNNKIRTETQEIIAPLSPYNRSTKKSLDRVGKDSNTLGLFFGPSVPLNEEIVKFFGEFKLGDYIGNPEDYDKRRYKDLDNFKKLFFREGFARVDWSVYLNTLKAYLDESLFENFEKLLPARSRVVSGLIVEPTLLERTKFKGLDLDNEIQSNVSDVTIVESTEKIKPLKNIRLSGRHTNKDIIGFANAPAFRDKPNTNNVVCLSSKFNYRKVSGTSFKDNLYNNFYDHSTSPDSYGLTSMFGHYYIDNTLYRVEKTNESHYVSTKFNSGLIDYTISTKYTIDLTIDDKEKLTTEEKNNISSVDGRYISSRNKNKKRVFENSAATWFVYYEPYASSWVLINDNPFNYSNTETMLTNGKNIRFYANIDQDGYFPDNFSINIFSEIPKLSGEFSTWSDFFVNKRKTGPVNYHKSYTISTSVSVGGDKIMKLEGSVVGVVDCNIEGAFTGEYTTISTDKYGVETTTKNKGHTRFNGTRRKLRLNGNFSGTLERGVLGNANTGSQFTLSDGFYNNKRFGGCNFSNKKMIGHINDIVESNPDYVKVNLDLYDSSKINKNEKYFDKVKLIPTPHKINYKFENKIEANRKVNLKRSSGNVVFYEDGVPKRNTSARYDNVFYHKTKDIIQQPMLNNIRITADIKIDTTELRALRIISYDMELIDLENNRLLEYQIKYKTNNPHDKKTEIDLFLKFIYSSKQASYVCDITKYSSGSGLMGNHTYTGYASTPTVKIEGVLENIHSDNEFIGQIYDNEDHIIKIKKEDLLSELDNKNCCILKYNLASSGERWIYVLGELDETESRTTDIHSYDFVQNAQDEFNYGGVNYLNSETESGVVIRNDVVEVNHHRHKIVDSSLDVGSELSLEITANEKMKYYLSVNRELDVSTEDDTEAIIYTHDTMSSISTINIRDKFLTYKCTLEPIFNQAYFPQDKSLSKYFLLLGTSEYNGFLVDGFVGKFKSANGQYRSYLRKNKKLTYMHTSTNWMVFYSITTPNCNKQGIRGAWVLTKIRPTTFFNREESELFSDKNLIWTYGFTESDFNSTNEVSYTEKDIRATTFDTDYGHGPDKMELRQTASISMYKTLCEDQSFVEEQSTLRNEEVIDTSFTLIPVKSTFATADEFAINYIGARNNILAWAIHVDSVENNLPTRAVYEKIYPTKDFDVSVEVEYTTHLGSPQPLVKLVGSDTRLSAYNKIEGEYYIINAVRNGHPVYRNASDYYIWKDTYVSKDGKVSVWVVGSDMQPLETNESDLLDPSRVIFISSQGVCTSDDFNFRLGYDITPNTYSTTHRNSTIATAFENTRFISNSGNDHVHWGMVRNTEACSTCDDNAYPGYDIDISPKDSSTLYVGSRKALSEIKGSVVMEIVCSRLECDEELLDFYGDYVLSRELGTIENPVLINQIQENLTATRESGGWEVKYTRILNENSTNKLISSKHTRVLKHDPIYEYPKYGSYISTEGDTSYLYFEKDEFDDINLYTTSAQESLHNKKFTKTKLVRNKKCVWHNNYTWFVFYNVEEFTGNEYWCISDILSDKKIKYRENIRDNGNGLDLDEVYGVYYLERLGELDFEERSAVVTNMKVEFNTSTATTIQEINDHDPSTFSYRVRTPGGYTQDTDAFEVRKLLSTTSNRITTNIPIDFNLKPNFFGLDIPGTSIVRIENDGKLNNVSYPVVKFSLDFLGTEINEEVELKIREQYDKIQETHTGVYKYEFMSQSNAESTANTFTTKKYRLSKTHSDSIPEIKKISINFNLDIFTSKEQTLIVENEKAINEIKDVVESFEDGSDEVSRSLILPFTNRSLYFNEIDYRLCDVNKIKIDGEIVTRGKQKQHSSLRRRLFRKTAVNTINTTRNRAGVYDKTSPITRKREVLSRIGHESGSHDSFWFIDDVSVVTQETSTPPKPYKALSDISAETRDKLEAYYSFNEVVEISWPNTPTPSPTPSASPTLTPSATTTPSASPTITPSATPSPTPTKTPSPSPSPSPTVTITPSLTPSTSPTASSTPTYTSTPSPSATPHVPDFVDFEQEVPILFRLIHAFAYEDNEHGHQNLVLDGLFYKTFTYNYRPSYISAYDMGQTKIETWIYNHQAGPNSWWIISYKVTSEEHETLRTAPREWAYYSADNGSAVHPGKVNTWKSYNAGEFGGNATLITDLTGMFDTSTYQVSGDASINKYGEATIDFTPYNVLKLQLIPMQGSSTPEDVISVDNGLVYVEHLEFDYTECLTEKKYKPSKEIYQLLKVTSTNSDGQRKDVVSLLPLADTPFGMCTGTYINGTGLVTMLKNIQGGPDLSKEIK